MRSAAWNGVRVINSGFYRLCWCSGVDRGQREHNGSFRGFPPKSGRCGVLLTLVRAISPLKLPCLTADLYRLPRCDPSWQCSGSETGRQGYDGPQKQTKGP